MTGEPISATVRLSVFVDPENQNRALASISDSPAGASAWQVIELDQLKHPAGWEYSVLLYELSKAPQDNVAREIGKNLYEVFFPNGLRNVFTGAKAQVPKGRLRIAIDASASLIEVPWELLHDGNDFLLRQDCSIIRITRELPPDTAYFGPITHVGLVACTPDFDASDHLQTLRESLGSLGVGTSLCVNPNRQALMEFLKRGPIDTLYFLGHGRNGQILLKAEGADPGWLDAGDLAQWLPDPRNDPERRVNLVSLFSCGTAECLPAEGMFSGVAQRLMLSQRIGTVVAMQAKIGLEHANLLASSFFKEVVQRGDPEAALLQARTAVANIWARSIPVLYTHVKGPEAFKRNRLLRLLAAKPEDKVAVSLPGFRMGLKYDVYETLKVDLFAVIKDKYNYRGRTFARSDVDAAKELLDLLTYVGSLDCVTILDDIESPDFPVTFFFGSSSHERISALVAEYAQQFKPQFSAEVWSIIDLPHRRRYDTPSPSRHAETYGRADDWGFIEKAISGDRCYFFICGLGDRATRGCALYLAQNWQELLDRHRDGPFAELVRFPGGLDYTHGRSVDRTDNKWGVHLG